MSRSFAAFYNFIKIVKRMVDSLEMDYCIPPIS